MLEFVLLRHDVIHGAKINRWIPQESSFFFNNYFVVVLFLVPLLKTCDNAGVLSNKATVFGKSLLDF